MSRMTEREANWKKRLLRTSVPLEHEAARILSARGFGVSADYPYHRVDADVEKEFSVDVRGVKGAGGLQKPGSQCLLDVLVECKYRDRGTTWLFLPEPRTDSAGVEDVLQAIDLFSPKFVHGRWPHDDPPLDRCYTGVEVGGQDGGGESDKSKGRAFEAQLRHGVRQLQYALPSLIALRARMAALLTAEDAFPFFLAPILLTNAPLMVAHASFGIASVETSEALEDVGRMVPYFVVC